MPANNGFFQNFFGNNDSGAGEGAGDAGSQPNGNQGPGEGAPGENGGQPNGQQSADQQSTGDAGQEQGSESNPLDIYNKMFDTTNSADDDAPPSLALSREALDKVTSQLDFSSGIDQAALDQFAQGDFSALPSMLNKVAQQAYSTAMQHNSALTDQYVNQRSEYDSKRIAPAVKSTLTQSHLDKDLGDLANQPAMKAQMSETASRLAKAYPDATPDWIASQAKQYVIQSASQLLGISPEDLTSIKANKQAETQKAQSVDWSTYFDKN